MMNASRTALLGAAVALVAIAAGSLFTVNEREQVLVLQFGEVKQQITDPGLHFKIPLIQNLRFFEKRILNIDPTSEEVILADQKRIVVDTFARYKITDMLKFFQTLGGEAAAIQRMNNIINASLRDALGNATLQDILSENRDKLMTQIRSQVNEETRRFGIIVVDVRIVRADLPEQTSQSVYARMRSEREREAAEARAQGQELAQEIQSKADKDRLVILAEAQRDAQVARGEGDREAIRIYAEAFGKDPDFYKFYRTMEAYRNSLANNETTMVLSPDSEFLQYLKASPKP